MPIIADVEDLAPAEFLLMMSLTSKSGKLSAVREKEKVLVVLREGSIVYAASPTVRVRLGSMLINRGLITEQQLEEALERQRSDPEAGLLGTVLVDSGVVSREGLAEVIRDQFEAVLRGFLDWERGSMIYERLDIPDLNEIRVDPSDVLVASGIETNTLLVESLARLEDNRSLSMTQPVESPQPPPAPPEGSRESMQSLLEELDELTLSLSAEMTLSIMGAAAEVAERALLLLVLPRHLYAIGGFGQRPDGEQIVGRRLWISRARRSLLTTVVDEGQTYAGLIDDPEALTELETELGALPTGEVMVVPMSVDGSVVAILYGDGGPADGKLGSAAPVEGAMAHVATELDRELASPRRQARFRAAR